MTANPTSLFGRTRWLLGQIAKRIWVRTLLFSLAAVFVALLATWIGPFLPDRPEWNLVSGSVNQILDILATSMLAVTTFSLSIMVAAYSAATSNATPRSTKLLLADSVAQNTLATFLGSFLFSIVGIIGLAAGMYSEKGKIILFGATLIVLLIIVGALIRWIEQLGTFGRVGDTIQRVERATSPVFEQAGRNPRLGALAYSSIPSGTEPVYAERTGIVEHIDVASMAKSAEEAGVSVFITATPGSLVHPTRAILEVAGSAEAEIVNKLRSCVSIGDDREYEQDPGFGLIVLSEIASRALSPATNDPGTAIEVLRAGLRALLAYADAREEVEPPQVARVYAPELDIDELFTSFFNPIARDGATIIEVQLRLLTVLEALAMRSPELFGRAARTTALRARQRSTAAMTAEHDQREMAERFDALIARLPPA